MPSNLSDRPVSPLRARMIEDMTVRGFTEKTRQDYVRHVQAFAAFIGRSPATATPGDIRTNFQQASATFWSECVLTAPRGAQLVCLRTEVNNRSSAMKGYMLAFALALTFGIGPVAAEENVATTPPSAWCPPLITSNHHHMRRRSKILEHARRRPV